MKRRGIVILFLLVYLSATTGFSLRQFYCCGKLKSTSLTLADIGKNKGDRDSKNDGCCKTEYHFFKVKDTHVAGDQITAPLIFQTDLAEYFASISWDALLIGKDTTADANHSPPLYPSIDIYISNCLFRI